MIILGPPLGPDTGRRHRGPFLGAILSVRWSTNTYDKGPSHDMSSFSLHKAVWLHELYTLLWSYLYALFEALFGIQANRFERGTDHTLLAKMGLGERSIIATHFTC